MLAYNVITSTSSRYAIDAWWGGSIGTGNQAKNNCHYNNSLGDVASQVGFTASGNQHLNPQYVNESAHTIAGYKLSSGSSCLAVVGYDTAAKLAGGSVTPAPAPTTAPAAPTGLKVLTDSSKVNLSWSANTETDVAGYNIYRSATSGGPYTQLTGSRVTGTSYTDTTVTNGKTYYYMIRAGNTSGLSSGNSNEVAVSLASVSCSLYASPSGSDGASGSLSSPFRSAQHLADSLQAGQTGCLLGGTYSTGSTAVKFNHGGTAGSPITLTSYPGQTATLTGGIVYVPQGSDYVTLTGLHIDGAAATTQNTIQIDAAHISVTDSDITNENLARSCFILGSDTGYGAATVPLVQGNVIHECGHVAPNQDHGINIDNVTGATITDNIFWGIRNGWAVHAYPDAQNTQITHNVMDGNGGGIIFGGNIYSTSSDNVAQYNVITNSTRFFGVESWWGGEVGSGNLATNNCLYNNRLGDLELPGIGYSESANQHSDPQYVNASAFTVDGYKLSSSSPCLAVVGQDIAAVLPG